jgi:hypothetical protein
MHWVPESRYPNDGSLLQQLLLPTASSDLWKMWGLFFLGFPEYIYRMLLLYKDDFFQRPKKLTHTPEEQESRTTYRRIYALIEMK